MNLWAEQEHQFLLRDSWLACMDTDLLWTENYDDRIKKFTTIYSTPITGYE